MEQLQKFTSVVPPHILAPAIIGVLTLLSVGILLQKSVEQDIYEPAEKHVIKVEEVRSLRLLLCRPQLSMVFSYGTIRLKV